MEILHAGGKDKDAIEAYCKLEPLGKWADRDLPVFRQLEPIATRWKADKVLVVPAPAAETPGGTDVATIDRIDLNTLGPLTWSRFLPSLSPEPTPPASHGPLPTSGPRARMYWSSFSWAGSAPIASSSSRSSARNTAPSGS